LLEARFYFHSFSGLELVTAWKTRQCLFTLL